MQTFVRQTKLSNIAGRADYITDPNRQECILAQSAAIDWTPYQAYELEHQRTDIPNNEGRELVIALPNDWAQLPADTLHHRVQQLTVCAIGKDTDLQWAVHWNKKHSNLHAHVIFSERTQLQEDAGRYTRDVYLTNDGKVARRSAERATAPDGSFLPPVHRKGDSKGAYTSKDATYKQKGWLHTTKTRLQDELKSFGAKIDAPRWLHEYHEGKGAKSTEIAKINRNIRRCNEVYDDFIKTGYKNDDFYTVLAQYLLNIIDDETFTTAETYDLPKIYDNLQHYAKMDSVDTVAIEKLLKTRRKHSSDLEKCFPFDFIKKKVLTDRIDEIDKKVSQLLKKIENHYMPLPHDDKLLAEEWKRLQKTINRHKKESIEACFERIRANTVNKTSIRTQVQPNKEIEREVSQEKKPRKQVRDLER